MNAVIETPVGTQLLSRPTDRMAMRAIFNELRDHHALFTILASSEIIGIIFSLPQLVFLSY